MKKNQWNQCSF